MTEKMAKLIKVSHLSSQWNFPFKLS